MSAVNEWVVREYFESLGYFVNQPRKHVIPARHKTPEEVLDLIVINPTVTDHRLPDHMVWTSADFRYVARAVVAVRGWHTERFYVSTFEQTPEILRFVESESIEFAGGLLGTEAMAKVLCLPRLPASGDLKTKTIKALKAKGIDGVLSFQTILRELIGRVDANRNYEKSDLLQIIRILKSYGLIRDDQLEFDLQHRGRRRQTAAASEEPGE